MAQDQQLREYEIYLDECKVSNTSPIEFNEWLKFYEKGELFLLEN